MLKNCYCILKNKKLTLISLLIYDLIQLALQILWVAIHNDSPQVYLHVEHLCCYNLDQSINEFVLDQQPM